VIAVNNNMGTPLFFGCVAGKGLAAASFGCVAAKGVSE